MLHYVKSPISNETIPDKVAALLEQGIKQYIILKDGHIVGTDLNLTEGLYIDSFDNALNDQADVITKIELKENRRG